MTRWGITILRLSTRPTIAAMIVFHGKPSIKGAASHSCLGGLAPTQGTVPVSHTTFVGECVAATIATLLLLFHAVPSIKSVIRRPTATNRTTPSTRARKNGCSSCSTVWTSCWVLAQGQEWVWSSTVVALFVAVNGTRHCCSRGSRSRGGRSLGMRISWCLPSGRRVWWGTTSSRAFSMCSMRFGIVYDQCTFPGFDISVTARRQRLPQGFTWIDWLCRCHDD